MTSKSTITRERLQEIAEDGFLKHGESKELARIALAAMDSEPVVYASEETLAYAAHGELLLRVLSQPAGDAIIPLYRHAQQSVVQKIMARLAYLLDEDQFHNIESMVLAAAPQPAPVVPEGLNPETADLVLRFASALADKLYKAEQKYGRSTDWMKSDWYDDCLQSLWEHIEKGDPRDVAAYCAFMWHHGWVTTDYDRNVLNACRAAMLAPAPQEVKSES
ncbi:hypothetical protein [Klebsiella michiganensis]|uniref:hypothetical protein n=1 Tax=Klebsiella michiganensis TaxID=1134687 RepID=UPI0034D1EBB2